MTNFGKAFALAAITGVTFYGGTISAATSDGDVGATSTGTIDVSLTTVHTVQLLGLNAINMSSSYGATDTDGVVGSDSFCVHRNGGDSYKFTVTWSDMSGTGGNSDTIALAIKVDGDDDASDGESVSTGTQATNAYSGSATRGLTDCDNASIYASASDANVRAASTDTYTTTVTVRVDPV